MRGYFSKPKGVIKQNSLGHTGVDHSVTGGRGMPALWSACFVVKVNFDPYNFTVTSTHVMFFFSELVHR